MTTSKEMAPVLQPKATNLADNPKELASGFSPKPSSGAQLADILILACEARSREIPAEPAWMSGLLNSE